MIPALKAAVAVLGKDPVWATVRPPLVALTLQQRDALTGAVGGMLRGIPTA